MPQKNGNTVAVERRVDLASLFCMIGRHGPAVALAVIAVISVLAGFVIYRTVRGKRRKATAAAADGDGESPGAERHASVIRPSPEESHSSVESTDVSDEGSSDVKEDVDLIESELKIRHRRAAAAAAEKRPPPYSPPKSDIQVPDNKHTTSGDTAEMAVVRDPCRVAETYAEEANQSLQSDTYTVAEMVVEAAADCHQGATDDIIEDVIEEVHSDDSCLKEPELINDENHEEEEKVFKAECQEDEDVTMDKEVSDKKTRQEEENFQCAWNNPVCLEQKGDDDRLQDDKTTMETNGLESNSEEPVIHIEDVPVPCICYGEDVEFEEDNPDSIDCRNYSGNIHLSPDEEKKNKGEDAEEECVDDQLIAPQAEMGSSTFEEETNLPSTQQDLCAHVTDRVTLPILDSDWDKDGGLACKVIKKVIDEDHLNKLTAVKFDAHSPQFNEQAVETELKAESGLTCNQEDGVLYDGADQEKEEMPTSDNIVPCSEECDSPALPCLSTPVKTDNHDDGVSGIATDAKAHRDQQSVQVIRNEAFDEASVAAAPDIVAWDGENITTPIMAEEISHPHVSSCYKDQQSVSMINNEVFDQTSVAVVPDIFENGTASVVVEELACPLLKSICQDQQSDGMENDETFDETRVNSATDAAACDEANLTALLMTEETPHPDMLSSPQDPQSDHMEHHETFDKTRVHSATDAPACDNATVTSPIMSEEISHLDMLSSSQDQQSDRMNNNDDFSEVNTGAAPVMAEGMSPPMCQIQLLSFEQSELRDNNISSPGVGEESGISSMAVSPDLQDTGHEFNLTVENMVLPVMDCDLQSEGQTEAQSSLFADDVAISVITEHTAGMVFGPFPSRCSQPPHSEHTDWTTNEDTFGHEIEDSYHREMDQFMEQIAARATSFTDELKKQTEMKVVIEVVEIKEKQAGVSVEKKKETEAEEEKEEDCERSEISIMEATMDYNEWITDSNYQVHPWMNLSAPSSAQAKTKQLPTEECQHSSALKDNACIDVTDIPPSTEAKQTSTLSLLDENTENNKKVVAVQPMPQSVNVTFRIHYITQSPYQTVAVTGNQQELGNWKGFIPLERAKDGHWAAVVSLPAESHVEWKFVLVEKGEVCRWEECGNRLLDTGYGDDLLVHKWWALL